MRKIAESMAGTVLKVREEITGNELALKLLNREHSKYLRTEINILKRIDHPNIVRLHGTKTVGKGWTYAKLEYCQFDLMDLLRRQNFKVSETEAANIMFQIFHAITYLHSRRVVHRDLKLRNVCVVGEKDLHKAVVKIIDFGLSVHFHKDMKLKKAQGTRHFMCPEMCQGRAYDTGCDVWSVGVIMHILLCGKRPFHGSDWAGIKHSIVADHITFAHERWNNVSRHAKELVLECLTKHPQYRIKTKLLCKHQWCKEFAPQMQGNFDKRRGQVLARLEEFTNMDSSERQRRVRLAPMISCQNRIVEHHTRMFTALERTGSSLLCDWQIGREADEVKRTRELRLSIPKATRLGFTNYLAIVLDKSLFDELEHRMSTVEEGKKTHVSGA